MTNKIKNKKILLWFYFIFFFLINAKFTFAASETNICTGDLPTCVTTIFKTGIIVAVGIAAASFAVGAIMFIMSGINASWASSGKDRMTGSILGIFLLVASWIIMNTINPALLSPKLTQLTQSTLPSPPLASGVYFFSDSGCTKSSIGSTRSDLDSIGDNVQGIKIVDDSDNSFGYILHATDGLKNGGQCGSPVTTARCQPVNGMNGAINVFQINPTPANSGTGLTFFSEPFGSDRGSKAGYFSLKASDIQSPKTSEDPTKMKFLYNGITVPDVYKNIYVYFADRPGSIYVNGSYLVALYSGGLSMSGNSCDSTSNGGYCQTFTNNVTNLNAQPIVASGTTTISCIYIFPTGAGSGDTTSGNGNSGGNNK